MNIHDIKKAALVMGIGYLFLSIYSFISLSNIEGLEAFYELQGTFYIGFALLTIGSFLCYKEHIYFKACFFSFLALDVFILAYIITGRSTKYISVDMEKISLVLKIMGACMNAGLALSNGLFIYGVKEVFESNKNKKMSAYSLVVEYGVTGLLTFCTIQSFIQYSPSRAIVGIILTVVLNVLIYANYAVFLSITHRELNKKDK